MDPAELEEQKKPPMEKGGYRRMALAMENMHRFAIFKRFGALNAQNLLYLQAELTVLEKRLEGYIEVDRRVEPPSVREKYDRDWETLKNSCEKEAAIEHNDRQWSTFLEIREKLKEYSELT